MRFFAAVFAAVTLAIPAFAAPTNGRYIVKLKDGATRANTLAQLNANARSRVSHEWDIINGFAGNFDAATLEALRKSPEVEYIEEDSIMTIVGTQTNAPWGLGRISGGSLAGQSDAALSYTYTYDDSAGSGVDVYVVDTGINTAHVQFGGRARWGATFGGYANADGNGHGTHCAGTVGSSQFGVAKAANLIAVKVLSDAGSGSVADIVSGLNWVGSQASATGRPSVASMSLGGGASTSLDSAVNNLAAQGVHVVVAAGNSNTDAANTSPARASGAVCVGATTIGDARASFSNYGAVVDIFAPGQNVISTWIGSTTATRSISGTSMACPHVAGLVAYLIRLQGNVSPSAMRTKLQTLSHKGVISGIPSGTVNYLAHI